MSNIASERTRGRDAYSWLWFSPFLTVTTYFFIQISEPGYSLLCSGWNDCNYNAAVFVTVLMAILVSAMWHLILLLQMGGAQTEFVRWHYRQALMLAGIRTAIPLVFLILDTATNGDGALLAFAIPALIIFYFVGTTWGRNQAMKGECWLAEKRGVTLNLLPEESTAPADSQQAAILADGSDNEQKETLDRLLANLQSADEARALAAIAELGALRFSSEAILHQLEKLALAGNAAALAALDLPTNRFVYSKTSSLNRLNRAILLEEIATWEADGLVEPHRADVLRRQYDFDTREARPASLVTPAPVTPPAPEPTPEPAAPTHPTPTTPPSLEGKGAGGLGSPAQPKLTLTQALLSETSVRIYLYLGAFLVIAAAAILAALVEAARLPVLLVATALFAGGAVTLKKRLPQPSFALAIVFSFLLPIDANVLADTLNLTGSGNDIFWTVTFLLMAVIWALGTWFYESRLFSVASFVSLALAALRFGEIFDASTQWNLFSVALVNLAALPSVRLLKNWKDQKFAQPIFLLAQFVQVVILMLSFADAMDNIFVFSAPGESIAATLTWLLAAAFYVLSDLYAPFIFFPWMAAATLFPLPFFFLSIFGDSPLASVNGVTVWGALIAIASEIVSRRDATKKYEFPLLLLSVPLFFTASILGMFEGLNFTSAFAALLTAGVVYTLINLPRPRVYVWIAALLFATAAYFIFFALPFTEKWNVDAAYQMLGASLLLLLPELFFKQKLTLDRLWNWPPVALGTFLALLNLLVTLLTKTSDNQAIGVASVVMGVYALLFAAYALRLKQPLLIYAATACAAFSVTFALDRFNKDWWLPALTALAFAYFAAGYYLARREATKSWATPLLASGLALGSIVSLVAVFTLKETGGWYALIVAVLFAIEMFTRRNTWLELGMESALTIALILILQDFKVTHLAYTYFGASLVWLASDLALHLSLPNRKAYFIPRIIGGGLTVAAFIGFANFEIVARASAICLTVYALFFGMQAWLYQRPWLGCIGTTAAATAIYFASGQFKEGNYTIPQWLPIFSGLILIYYAAGFLLFNKDSDWGRMLRYSGLALGVITSVAALVTLEPYGGWYVLVIGTLFALEMFAYRNGWFEAGALATWSVAAFLLLREFNVEKTSYITLSIGMLWLLGDMFFEKLFPKRTIRIATHVVANLILLGNAIYLLMADVTSLEVTVCFAAYALAYVLYAWAFREPRIAYASTTSLALSLYYGLHYAATRDISGVLTYFEAWNQTQWLLPLIGLASLYYLAGFLLRRANTAPGWNATLLYSGLGLGTIVACAAPWESGGVEKSIPIALAATFYAAEAFGRRNVWLGFPANAFYLAAYFVILNELDVTETQFFTVGAAALGLLMHYLLRRAGAKRTAFITGLVSQLVLLGASYIQMVDTGELKYFFVLFFQALVVLAYGAMFIRSRSLTIAPIGFLVLAIVTVLYNALKDLSLVFIIGITGLILLGLGILAVVMRERITDLAERFGDWDA